jgi:hypothetical protein
VTTAQYLGVVTRDRTEASFVFAIAGDAPRGQRRSGRLEITTFGANVPADLKLGLEVEAAVRPMFVIEPAALTAHAVPDGSIAFPDSWVTSTTGDAFDVRSIADSGNNVIAAAHSDGPGTVRVTAKAIDFSGRLGDHTSSTLGGHRENRAHHHALRRSRRVLE